MSKRKRKHRPKSASATGRGRSSNPMSPWLHGLAAMGDERWEEAIPSLQRFLEMARQQQDRRQAYRNLGACYLALDRYDEALVAVHEAERCAPDDPTILHSRGVVCACAGRVPEAIAAFERYAHRSPRQARQHETRKAIRQLRRAQTGKSPVGTYLVDHLQEQIGHNVEMGDWHLVEEKARRMIAADRDRPEGHFALGIACLEQGRHSEALAAFQTAHTRNLSHEPTLYNLGHTCLQLDRPEQAIPWLERALRQEPKKLATLHELGRACEQLGRRDEAVNWWQRALEIDPEYDLAQQRLHKVGRGPEPAEPPLPPTHRQLQVMTPIVKARMRQPRVQRNGGVTLTWDGKVGFVLEDEENPRNATIHAGGPFQTARIQDEDLLDLMGLTKLLLSMIDAGNTRDVAVLVYYADRPVFGYQARFERGKQVELDHGGQFVVTEIPCLFKLRIDSDLSTPYGDPMQGKLIYLSQQPNPGILLSTLGLGSLA